MPSYFITGTGTGIGKTYVTAGLLRAGRALRHDFTAIKPVLSGYDPADMHATDSAMLLQAMAQPVTAETIAAITPWRFTAPLSPDMAARREGQRIALADVAAFCQKAMAAARGTLLIEGVGGAAVPLNDAQMVSDLITALDIPVILVAGTYLGTISHSITTAAFLAARGARLAALVLSESADSPVPPAETAATLRRFLTCPLHIIPRNGDDGAFRQLAVFLRPF